MFLFIFGAMTNYYPVQPFYKKNICGIEYWYDQNEYLVYSKYNSGTIFWYCSADNWGPYHRIGGPAIEWPDGGKEWWFNSKKIWECE